MKLNLYHNGKKNTAEISKLQNHIKQKKLLFFDCKAGIVTLKLINYFMYEQGHCCILKQKSDSN